MAHGEQLKNWILRAAALLLCLTLLSLFAMSRLYARYTTATSFSDGARVARFQFEANDTLSQQESYAVSLDPQTSQKIEITLHSNSEVALRCSIAFTSTGNAPLEFAPEQTQLDGLTLEKDTDADTWHLDIPAGSETTVTPTFTVQLANAGYENAGSVAEIALTVRTEQLD